MGDIQRKSTWTFAISIVGLGIGYLNKAVLFPIFLLPDEIGLISLILTQGALFAGLSNLGATHGIRRFFPYVGERYKRSFFKFNLKIITIGFLFFGLLTLLLKDPIFAYFQSKSGAFLHYAWWVYLLGASNLIFTFFENYLKAVLHVVLPVFIQEFVLRLVVTCTLVGYALNLYSFELFLMLHLGVHLLPFLALFGKVLRNKVIVGQTPYYPLKAKFKVLVVKYSSLVYLNTIGATLIFSIDTVMLAAMNGLTETGIYSTVLFISSALLIPYRAIHNAATVFVPDLWKKNDLEELNKLYRNVSAINLLFLVFLLLLVGWNIYEIFTFFPKSFAIGIPMFFLLMIGRGSDAFSGINGYILITSKKHYIDTYFTLTMVVTVIFLNWLLIPSLGGVGTSIATSVVLFLYNGLRIGYYWYQYKLNVFSKSNLVLLLVGTIISLPLIFVSTEHWNIYLAIGIKSTYITLAYFGTFIYLKTFPEINRNWEFIRKKLKF